MPNQQHQSIEGNQTYQKLECGPMSNVMAALPNIGGALLFNAASLADAQF